MTDQQLRGGRGGEGGVLTGGRRREVHSWQERGARGEGDVIRG